MKRFLLWFSLAVVVLVIAAVAAVMFVDADTFRPQIEAQLTASLGRKVTLGKLHLSLLNGALSATDIVIADDPAFNTGNFLTAKSFSTGVEMKPLIFNRILHVTSVQLNEPQVSLIRNAKGVWNFSSLGGFSSVPAAQTSRGGSSGLESFSVDKLEISNGQLTLAKAGGGAQQVWSKVHLTAENIEYGKQIPLTLTAQTPGKGTIDLSGTAGPLDAMAGGSVGSALMHMKFTVKNLPAEDVQGLMAVLGGSLPTGDTMQGGVINSDLQLEGPFDKLTTSGPVSVSNVKLVGNIAQKLSTLGKLTGTTTGNVTNIKNMSAQLRMTPQTTRADNINVLIPALGTLTGAGTIDAANRMSFNMLAKLNANAGGSSQISQLGGQAAQISQAMGSAASTNGVQFTITGTTSNPIVTVNTKAAATSVLGALAQQQLKKQGQQQSGGLAGTLGKLLGKKP